MAKAMDSATDLALTRSPAPPILQRSAFLGWRRRWTRIVSVSCSVLSKFSSFPPAERTADEHQEFFDLLLSVPKLQWSWLLLVHCASPRRTICCALCVHRECARRMSEGLGVRVHVEPVHQEQLIQTRQLSHVSRVFEAPSRQAPQHSWRVRQLACHDHDRFGRASGDSVFARSFVVRS